MNRRHFLGSMAAAPLLRPVFRKPKNTPIDVGNEKQLLIDDLFFEVHEGIRLTINPPRKTGEHLVVCDRPWEDWFIAQLSTIKDDDGTYKPTFPISTSDPCSSDLPVTNNQNLSALQPRNKCFSSYFG